MNPFSAFLISTEIYTFLHANCEGSYKWCHLIQMAWKSKSVLEEIAPSSLPFCALIARAVTAFKHTWNDGNMFSQAIAFLRFLIRAFFSFRCFRLFFINCRFHPPKHEHGDERKKVSFWLVNGDEEEKVPGAASSFSGVSKSFICFSVKRALCPFLMIIWFLFPLQPLRSNCWAVKCYVA